MSYPVYRRRSRTCEICGVTYSPTYSKQRSCGRACGLIVRFGEDVGMPPLKAADLNAPTTRETAWWKQEKKRRASKYMLARYHADPRNWSIARKRRRLFERDNWTCRTCGKHVTDTVPPNHPTRAVAGHIVARATGGEWTDENMATLCYPCNVKDGVNKLPIQTHIGLFDGARC